MPPSSPSVNRRLWWNLSATWRSTRTASRVTSMPMPSPGNTRTLSSMKTNASVRRRYLGHLPSVLPTGVNKGDDFFVHQALLSVIGNGGKAKVDVVQFGLRQHEPQFLG